MPTNRRWLYCLHGNFHEICPRCLHHSDKWLGGNDDLAGLPSYLSNLALTKANLTGQLILDVGAGGSYFYADMIEDGIRAVVVSLDPEYSWRRRRWHEGKTTEQLKIISRTKVAGKGEALPFSDASFDLVVGYRILQWMLNLEAMEQLLRESVRVMKAGGQARLAPLGMLGREYRDDLVVKQEEMARSLPGTSIRFIKGKHQQIVLSIVKEPQAAAT